MSTASSTETARQPRRDRSHYLYLAVIVGVVLGIAVGLIAPEFAVGLKPIGTAFVALIKMMISPVIFCTIVLGVGSVASAAHVGKVGGLALAYFLTMSTVALGIGLVVGNLIQPGDGLNITADVVKAGVEQAGESGSTTDFLLGVIPVTLFSALTEGEVLQTLLVALLVGFAVQAMGASGKPVIRGVEHLQRVVFRVLAMIMWAAPVGAFGAIAGVVGETGVDALKSLAILMLAFYITCALFVFVMLGHDPQARHRREHLQPAEVPRPRVPADPVDLVLGVGAAAADGEDGARRHRQDDRRCRRTDRLLVQPGRHRDLPDDGVAVHRRGAGQAARDRRADLAAGVHGHRLQGRRRRHRRRPRHPGRRAVLAPPRAARRRRPDRRASTASCPRPAR